VTENPSHFSRAGEQPEYVESIADRKADYQGCPFCGEQILAMAKKCKHCGETVDVTLRAAEESRRLAERPVARRSKEFRCPFCNSDSPPAARRKISTAGWVIFVILLIACFPLCIIGLFIRKRHATAETAAPA
jgi:uncharacterized membrane protein YvbJ